MDSAINFVFQIIILIFSVVVHEISHGYAALILGDKTAQLEGRLTLNPLKHLDPFGSVILPTISYLVGGVIFGWAKPVPYNPYALRNQKWGPALVGVAGPAANIFLALFFGGLLRFSKELFGYSFASSLFAYNFIYIVSFVALINIVLAVFNLIPIPPLDGSKILFALLPYRFRGIQFFFEQYGLFLLLIFVFFFMRLLSPVIFYLFRALTGGMPFL